MPYSISRADYDICHFGIYLIFLPIICIVGLTGNSYSLYILRSNPTKVAFCTYLKALTCSDTLLLACALLRSLFLGFKEANLPYAQKINVYVKYAAGIVCGSALQRLSSSLITVIAIERVLVVVYPLRVRSMIIETRPVRIIVALVVFFTLLQLPTFAIINVKEIAIYHPENTSTYAVQRTEFAKQETELAQVYLFSLAILGTALPLLTVIVSTSLILSRVKMQLKGIASRRITGGSIEMERMTLTLVTMAIFFTLMSVPAVIIYVWSAYDRSPDTLYLRALFADIDIALVCLNSASDFIIYCLASNRFKEQFLQRLCGVVRRTQNDTSSTSYIRTIALNIERNSNACWEETSLEAPSCLHSSPRV